MLVQAFVTLISVLIVYRWYKKRKLENKLKWVPRAPGKPIIGNVLDFGNTTEILGAMTRYTDKYNGKCLLDFLGVKCILTTDHQLLEFLLGTTKILNKSIDYEFLHGWLGNGLLTSKAARWKKSRKIITPAFHFSILEQFVPVFESNGNIMVDLLEKEVDKDAVDIFPYVTMCTLDIICGQTGRSLKIRSKEHLNFKNWFRFLKPFLETYFPTTRSKYYFTETAMGVSIDAQRNRQSEYVFAVKEMCRIIIERTFSALKRTNIFYPLFADFYKERKYLHILHSRTESVIASRRKELRNKGSQGGTEHEGGQIGIKKKMAFLDLLLNSTMDGKFLPDGVIREEVDTFMFEGHDTTASALGFTLYCLADHPEVQVRKIYTYSYKIPKRAKATAVLEQKAIFGKDRQRAATYRDLQDMKYLEMVIKETLRLYPSVPFFSRQAEEDVEYKDGLIIPKGVVMAIFVYGINRNPKFFSNPDKFDPRRFEDMDGSSPYSYLPFSAGPRNCIGQKFAMLELKATISKMLRNFELLQASPRHELILAAETILKSVNGVRIKLRKRSTSL